MNPTTPAAILRAARALLEKGWCQGAYAKDGKGQSIPWWDEARVASYCSIGSIYAIAHQIDGSVSPPLVALQKAIQRDESLGIATWNDAPGRTLNEVLAAFDKAIALAENP